MFGTSTACSGCGKGIHTTEDYFATFSQTGEVLCQGCIKGKLTVKYKIFTREGYYLCGGTAEYGKGWETHTVKELLRKIAKKSFPKANLGYITTEACLYWKPLLFPIHTEKLQEA